MAQGGRGPARDAADAVARRSYGNLVAFLASRTRDVAGAEDALSEAFAAALEHWPAEGVPRNPEAWLMAVAKRRMIDAARRRQSSESGAVPVSRFRPVNPATRTAAGPVPATGRLPLRSA